MDFKTEFSQLETETGYTLAPIMQPEVLGNAYFFRPALGVVRVPGATTEDTDVARQSFADRYQALSQQYKIEFAVICQAENWGDAVLVKPSLHLKEV